MRSRAVAPGGRTDGPPGKCVSVHGRDLELLIFAWLNELIGRSERDGRAYGDVRHIVVSSIDVGGANVLNRSEVLSLWPDGSP